MHRKARGRFQSRKTCSPFLKRGDKRICLSVDRNDRIEKDRLIMTEREGVKGGRKSLTSSKEGPHHKRMAMMRAEHVSGNKGEGKKDRHR